MSLGEPGIEHAQGEYAVVISSVPSSLLPRLERSLGKLGLSDNLSIAQTKSAPDDCDEFTVADLSSTWTGEMRRPLEVLNRTVRDVEALRMRRIEAPDGTAYYLGDTAYTLAWFRLNRPGMITSILGRFLKRRSQEHAPAQGELPL